MLDGAAEPSARGDLAAGVVRAAGRAAQAILTFDHAAHALRRSRRRLRRDSEGRHRARGDSFRLISAEWR